MDVYLFSIMKSDAGKNKHRILIQGILRDCKYQREIGCVNQYDYMKVMNYMNK
jgi:hypothetical protein